MPLSLRRRLLAALLLGAGAALAPSAFAETLSEALALAYQTNPTLQAQFAAQRSLDESYVQARAGYRPQLTLGATASYQQIRTPHGAGGGLIDTNGDGVPDSVGRGISESNSAAPGLDLVQPLWTGGRVSAAISAAQGDILSGRETLRQTEAEVLLSVVQAYLDVRRDQEGAQIRVQNVKVLDEQLKEARARAAVGGISRTDVAQAEARLAAAQALQASAVAQLATSRARYTAVVGQTPGELAPPPTLTALLPRDGEEAISVAKTNSPILRAQQYAEQASRARVAVARAERMPTVSLRLQAGFTGQAAPFEPGLFSRDVLATAEVRLPIFTGGLSSSRIRQSVDRNNVDRIGVEAQRRSVLLTLSQAWNQLVAARANIESTQQSVRAANIAAEGTRQEKEAGLRTTLDVLNAEQELADDQLTVAAARHDEYLAAATVLSAMGRLEAKDLIPWVVTDDPPPHFRRLKFALGYVPWEEPIAAVDRALAAPSIPQPHGPPPEPAIGSGLEPPGATVGK